MLRDRRQAGLPGADGCHEAHRRPEDRDQRPAQEDQGLYGGELPGKLVRALRQAPHCAFCTAQLPPAAAAGRTWYVLRVSASCCALRIQSLFNSLGDEVKGATIGLGGDGRYWNKQATQIILKIAAAAGVKKVCGILATEYAAA
jgi:hypothetical protein